MNACFKAKLKYCPLVYMRLSRKLAHTLPLTLGSKNMGSCF